MREEVENRTVNLAISTAKLTAHITLRLALWGIRRIKEGKAKAETKRNLPPRGKQITRKLVGQNQGVTNIDIVGTDLKGFGKHIREFGVNYAITRDKSVDPPKYLVFFKARDTDAMAAAFDAYSAEVFAKDERPSVLKTLRRLMDAIRNIPTKVISRNRQKGQSRRGLIAESWGNA